MIRIENLCHRYPAAAAAALDNVCLTVAQGEALGLRLVAVNASSVLMPLLFGTAGSLVGVSGVFWGVSGLLIVGVRGALGLKRAAATPKPAKSGSGGT